MEDVAYLSGCTVNSVNDNRTTTAVPEGTVTVASSGGGAGADGACATGSGAGGAG